MNTYQSKSTYCYCPCCGDVCVLDSDGAPQLCNLCYDRLCDEDGCDPSPCCLTERFGELEVAL